MMLLSLAVSLLFPLKINIWLLYRVGWMRQLEVMLP
jgi:hypothetical protein